MFKMLILLLFIFTAIPVFADNVNMTPKSTFSGYNDNSVRLKYPKLNYEQQRTQIMKPVSVKSFSQNEYDNTLKDNSPVSINKFPASFDSSDMLHMQGIQNGIQNMYMGL